MPYLSGSAADMTALRTALFSACTANGWTLSGEVIHRGACYTRLQVVGEYLTLLGGTGIDGSNNLTGAAANVARLGRLASGMPAITWPMAYEIFIHTNPDEVYLVCNYNVDSYLFAAFGLSGVAGLTGTGGWFSASANTGTPGGAVPINISAESGQSYAGVNQCPGLFWATSIVVAGSFSSHINHGLDGESWNVTNTRQPSAIHGSGKLIAALPSAWNSEAILVPIQVWIPRSSGNKISLVAELGHARHTRIDNYAPGEIVVLGPDQWKVFPNFKKNASVRNGGSGIDHTGTFGFAVRYDGP